MKTLGSIIIGVLTAIAGFPIYNDAQGFSVKNLIICSMCISLWQIIFYKIEQNEKNDNMLKNDLMKMLNEMKKG